MKHPKSFMFPSHWRSQLSVPHETYLVPSRWSVRRIMQSSKPHLIGVPEKKRKGTHARQQRRVIVDELMMLHGSITEANRRKVKLLLSPLGSREAITRQNHIQIKKNIISETPDAGLSVQVREI